ncbi:hypothetical protein [Sporomusa sphaeroides]|uniref:phage tail tube protein n=1 Tax=Sporomusa sphaeroides TaxID=47679 RepID=UPI002BDFD182|nr:hypothetical protein [Sporomusa sphaeroides]HML33854.1 hypothetical protein [Sporomusa sphaeroides]
MSEFKLDSIDLQLFATKSGSNAEDLMLGAGTIYFERFDRQGQPTGILHHCGNVDAFNLTTEVTTVAKNSSMNRARELMAEVTTQVAARIAMTFTEYDPVNLSLGLYGEAGVETQEEKTVAGEIYTVSPDSVLRLPYYNVSDVILAPLSATPAEVGAAVMQTSLGTDGTLTTGGTYTGTESTDYYIRITAANTAPGAIAGCEFQWAKGSVAGTYSADIEADGSAQVLEHGITVQFNVAAGQNFVANEIYKFTVTAASGAYVKGRDYHVYEVEARAGIINIPPTSTIPENSKIVASYQVAKGKFPKIMGAIAGRIEGRLLFIGDPNKGPCYNGEFWKCSMKPNGDLSGLIGTEFGSYPIQATCISDRQNHPDEPFYKLVKVM